MTTTHRLSQYRRIVRFEEDADGTPYVLITLRCGDTVRIDEPKEIVLLRKALVAGEDMVRQARGSV